MTRAAAPAPHLPPRCCASRSRISARTGHTEMGTDVIMPTAMHTCNAGVGRCMAGLLLRVHAAGQARVQKDLQCSAFRLATTCVPRQVPCIRPPSPSPLPPAANDQAKPCRRPHLQQQYHREPCSLAAQQLSHRIYGCVFQHVARHLASVQLQQNKETVSSGDRVLLALSLCPWCMAGACWQGCCA